jgi:MGT family glycosyltransferase
VWPRSNGFLTCWQLAERWRPDLIVRESTEWAGCLVAELLGLPHASVATSAFSALEGFLKPDLAEPLAERRAEAGLGPDPEMAMMFRYLHLCFMPARFDGPDAAFPPTAHFLRHQNLPRPGESPPPWFDDLDDRPIVLASLGTVFHATAGLLETVIAGLAAIPANVVVAVGRDQDLARFGPQPAHIRLERYLPQTLVLSRCAVFVTHGGFNSVREALSLGVPLLVLPIAADQFYAAARCAALGVARVIDPQDRNPNMIAGAVRAVLADRSHGERARQMQADIASLPGLEHAVTLLEDLASRRTPITKQT